MAILVVVLVMLFLSTAVSTASKVNAKVRKTDVALTYKNADKGSETKTLTISRKNNFTLYVPKSRPICTVFSQCAEPLAGRGSTSL